MIFDGCIAYNTAMFDGGDGLLFRPILTTDHSLQAKNPSLLCRNRIISIRRICRYVCKKLSITLSNN